MVLTVATVTLKLDVIVATSDVCRWPLNAVGPFLKQVLLEPQQVMAANKPKIESGLILHLLLYCSDSDVVCVPGSASLAGSQYLTPVMDLVRTLRTNPKLQVTL
jgi:hypothetical protein